MPFSLLADTKAEVIRLFDAAMTYQGRTLAARKIVLIDRHGVIAYRDDKYVLANGEDLEALKKAVRALK